jgi:hypothetical protein
MVVLATQRPATSVLPGLCIGALIAHREADYWAVDAVGAPHVGERTLSAAAQSHSSISVLCSHRVYSERQAPEEVPDQSVIVWDLETVPDLAGFAVRA